MNKHSSSIKKEITANRPKLFWSHKYALRTPSVLLLYSFYTSYFIILVDRKVMALLQDG